MRNAKVCFMALLFASIISVVIQVVNGQEEEKTKDERGLEKAQTRSRFVRLNEGAIPGEYIVVLVNEGKSEEIEKIADQLIEKYGGSIQVQDEITSDTKREDGSISREVVKPAGKAIFNRKTRKGFYIKATEAQAIALSQDALVDHVGELGSSKSMGIVKPIQQRE